MQLFYKMDFQLNFSLPVWLMAGFLYTLYFTLSLCLWGWILQMLCYHGKNRMGLWVWKAWLGLNIRRDANELSDWVVETMLNDYHAQTGIRYRSERDIELMEEIGATFPFERRDEVSSPSANKNTSASTGLPQSTGFEPIFIEEVFLSDEEKAAVIQEVRRLFPETPLDEFVFDKTDLTPKTERVVRFVSDLK